MTTYFSYQYTSFHSSYKSVSENHVNSFMPTKQHWEWLIDPAPLCESVLRAMYRQSLSKMESSTFPTLSIFLNYVGTSVQFVCTKISHQSLF